MVAVVMQHTLAFETNTSKNEFFASNRKYDTPKRRKIMDW